MNDVQSIVDQVRASSRLMVRELGFMRPTIAGTRYSPSAVHALIEIDEKGESTAASLVDVLQLEKSSVSRMVSKLVDCGEVKDISGEGDARVKRLLLTSKGRRTVAGIHAYGQKQVGAALRRLNLSQQAAVARGLSEYASALVAERTGKQERATLTGTARIVSGYLPGAVGRIAEMHAGYYSKNHGLGQSFESKVAAGLAEFVGRLDRPGNRLWLVVNDGRIVGSVAIDGEDLGGGVGHLRWFILDDEARGRGFGRKLLEEATAFCDRRRFESTQLWTFKGLDAARRLYEQFGFTLAKEWRGEQWGANLAEQQFSRPRQPVSASA